MISELDKLILAGKLKRVESIYDDPEEVTEDDPLTVAIGDLSEKIKDLSSVSVDLSPVMDLLGEVVDIQKRMLVKRKWKHSIKQDNNGDISEIISTEL